ncbi:hypothetical protein R3P38DRAFT_3193287 [Favolaschia claudopus]|uniref:Uncharacterized protein n=1 Tax=Favolaschia claudopus TaxID=2862362 RepID=A0AAW0BI74_9AGAR
MCFPLLLYYALPFIAYCVFTQLSRRRASSTGLITASSTAMQFASASMHFRLHVSSTAKHPPALTCATLPCVSYGDITPVPTCAYAYVRLLRRYIRQCLHAPTPTCVSYGDTSASAYMHLRLQQPISGTFDANGVDWGHINFLGVASDGAATVSTCTYTYVRFPTAINPPVPTCTYAYMRPYGDKSASAYRHLRLYASPTAIRLPAPTCATLVSVSYGDTSARAYMRLHCQRPHASTMNHMRLGYTCTCMHKLIQQGMVSL